MRRLHLMFVAAVVLLGSQLVDGSYATAQDTEYADHPLVGTWELIADLGDGDTSCPSQAVFTDEGAYIDVDCADAVVIGSWEPTGDLTANMTFTSSDPEGGTYKIRVAVEVAADGQTFTGPFTIEFEPEDPMISEGMGEFGPGMATGTRLVAEGPGTPQGSIMDLFSQVEDMPEATPVATPAS